MRKVILSMFVTLDGFIEGPSKELDWPIADEEMDRDTDEFLSTVDAILLGRATYQLFLDYWPSATKDDEIIADKMNEIPKIVFSRTLEKAEWGKWDNARLVKDNVEEEIKNMKRSPGKDMVIFGGAGIAQTFTDLGLIDEYQLRVCPVVLGGGKPLFKNTNDRLNMKLLRTKTYGSGVVQLYYQPVGKRGAE